MIDPIDDGSDDSPDVPESEGPSWFACRMSPRSDMLAVIERHKKLDGRAVNLFRNALQRKPRSDLFEHYLGPNLYHPRLLIRVYPNSIRGFGQEPAIGVAHTLERRIHWIAKSSNTTNVKLAN